MRPARRRPRCITTDGPPGRCVFRAFSTHFDVPLAARPHSIARRIRRPDEAAVVERNKSREFLMSGSRQALCALALMCVCVCAAAAPPPSQRPAEEAAQMSADTRHVAQWVLDAHDHQGRPFAIVDKKVARLYLFDSRGRLAGTTPVLLGMARGDHSAPGVGMLPPSRIPMADRTTPAGRFVSEPGRNLDGEDLVWVDYDAGIAIHRLRPAAAQQARNERMASAEADDNRISAGCIVVPVAFYESTVKPMLGRQRGVVYVLPEMRSASEMFGVPRADL
jgi:hypothetical protein